jgi:hypothetical protein
VPLMMIAKGGGGHDDCKGGGCVVLPGVRRVFELHYCRDGRFCL